MKTFSIFFPSEILQVLPKPVNIISMSQNNSNSKQLFYISLIFIKLLFFGNQKTWENLENEFDSNLGKKFMSGSLSKMLQKATMKDFRKHMFIITK